MTALLPDDAARLVHAASPISLEELQEGAALGTRIDRKYVVDWATLSELLTALIDSHRVLEIDRQRVFRYESVYFDSADLSAFRAHLQGRRCRYKVRSRHYVDSGLKTFEIKLKGSRGETIKHQMRYDDEDLACVIPTARPAPLVAAGPRRWKTPSGSPSQLTLLRDRWTARPRPVAATGARISPSLIASRRVERDSSVTCRYGGLQASGQWAPTPAVRRSRRRFRHREAGANTLVLLAASSSAGRTTSSIESRRS